MPLTGNVSWLSRLFWPIDLLVVRDFLTLVHSGLRQGNIFLLRYVIDLRLSLGSC